MALKAKSNETDESSNYEDSKMKSYITRQFKSQDKGKKDAKDGGQYNIPFGPKCFGFQGFGHMKQEFPTYLKSIGKSRALAATLSDIEPEIESNESDYEGILSAFTITMNSTEGS